MKAFVVMSLVNLLMVLLYLVILGVHVFRRLSARLRGWITPREV